MIDESGEDYAYVAERFYQVELLKRVEWTLLVAVGRVVV
jgi:hypothetical protein